MGWIMGTALDSIVAIQILRLLVKPIEQWEAFKLGIVDRTGKEIRKPVTPKELESYDMLARLVLRLKAIIAKVPIENKNFLNFGVAYMLIKESMETENYDNLEERYYNLSESKDSKEIDLSMSFLVHYFGEDAGMGIIAGGEPSVQNTTDALNGNTLAITKKKQKKIVRRNETKEKEYLSLIHI